MHNEIFQDGSLERKSRGGLAHHCCLRGKKNHHNEVRQTSKKDAVGYTRNWEAKHH